MLEESLAVRSVERTVEEVLLPAVEALRDEDADTAPAPEYGFAWRWATGWLAAAQRAAPPATRPEAVVVFDASAACAVDALHAQALELVLRRRGLRTLTLSVGLDASRLARALTARDAARHRAHGPRRAARRPRAPGLRRAPRRRRLRRGLRLPRPRCPRRARAPSCASATARWRPWTCSSPTSRAARRAARARRGRAAAPTAAEAAAHLRAVAG